MATVKEILESRLANVDALLAAAKRSGLPVYVAAALLDMESEGKNIWGSDVGGTFSGRKGDVTETDYKAFRKKIDAGAKSNGVGPTQITWKGFFPDAEKQGLKLWVPEDNMYYGFKLLKGYADKYPGDWQKVGRLYNGKDSYGDTFVRVVGEWKTRLAAANDNTEAPVSKGLTPAQLLAAFKKWGVVYTEHEGWKTHNRNGHGDWAPNGLILHHTGDDAPDTADEKVVWAGRSDLPGPLCHWGMRDDGTLVLIGSGRANHAGQGSQTTLNHVIKEDYDASKTLKPGADNVDGNAHYYGQETFYSGNKPMTKAAYENTVRAFAAVCDAHGWSAKSCIGHKEHTSRKPDPGSLDMGKFRKDVQAALDAGPKGTPPKPPTVPVPVQPSLDAKYDTSLSPNERSPLVPSLKRALNLLGLFPKPDSPTYSTLYDNQLQEAIATWHLHNSKYSSGGRDVVIGPKGWVALMTQAKAVKG